MLRRGAHRFPWLFLILTAAITAVLTIPSRYQPATWADLVVAVRENSWLVGLLCALVACGRARRAEPASVLGGPATTRGAVRRLSVLAGQPVLAAGLGIVLGSVPVALVLLRSATDDASRLGALVPSLTALLVVGSIGAGAALAFSGRASFVLTAAAVLAFYFGPYLLTAPAIGQGRSFVSLSPRWGNSFPELGWDLVPMTLAAQASFFVLLGGGLFVLATSMLRCPSRILTDPVVLLALLPGLVCAAGLILVQPALARPDANPPVTCVPDPRLTVCGHAQRAPVLEDVQDAAQRVLDLIDPPVQGLPVLAAMEGFGGASSAPGARFEIYVYAYDDRATYLSEVTREVASQLLGFNACLDRMPPPMSMEAIPPEVAQSFNVQRALVDDVMARIETGSGGPPGGLTDAELASALHRHWGEVQECRLTPDALVLPDSEAGR